MIKMRHQATKIIITARQMTKKTKYNSSVIEANLPIKRSRIQINNRQFSKNKTTKIICLQKNKNRNLI